jgi:hypothetical protein
MYSPENLRLRRGGGLCCDRRRACSGLDASSALEGHSHLGRSRCHRSGGRFRVSPRTRRNPARVTLGPGGGVHSSQTKSPALLRGGAEAWGLSSADGSRRWTTHKRARDGFGPDGARVFRGSHGGAIASRIAIMQAEQLLGEHPGKFPESSKMLPSVCSDLQHRIRRRLVAGGPHFRIIRADCRDSPSWRYLMPDKLGIRPRSVPRPPRARQRTSCIQGADGVAERS